MKTEKDMMIQTRQTEGGVPVYNEEVEIRCLLIGKVERRFEMIKGIKG